MDSIHPALVSGLGTQHHAGLCSVLAMQPVIPSYLHRSQAVDGAYADPEMKLVVFDVHAVCHITGLEPHRLAETPGREAYYSRV